MKKVKLSVAEQISLATSLIGTVLSAFSFLHSPTVVAKVPPLMSCNRSSLNTSTVSPTPSNQRASAQTLCYSTQKSAQTSLIYAKLREISHRLNKLEANLTQAQSNPLSPLALRSQLRSSPQSSHRPQPVAENGTSIAKDLTQLQPKQQLEQSPNTPSDPHAVKALKPRNLTTESQNGQAQAHPINTNEKWVQQQQIYSAIEQFQQALKLYTQMGDRVGESEMLDRIAALYDQLGQHAEAEKLLRQKLALLQGMN